MSRLATRIPVDSSDFARSATSRVGEPPLPCMMTAPRSSWAAAVNDKPARRRMQANVLTITFMPLPLDNHATIDSVINSVIDSVIKYMRTQDLQLLAQEQRRALDILEEDRLAGGVHQDVTRRVFLHRHLADEIAFQAVRCDVPLLGR